MSAILLALAAVGVFGQSADSPRFDVASIKPNSSTVGGAGDIRALPGGRLTAEGVLARFLIQDAYGVKPFQISGGPGWVNSDRYDIDAKAQGNPSRAQTRLMTQALLAERFKLKIHRETRELPVYVLTAAKNGINLQPPKEGGCADPNTPEPLPPPNPGQPELAPCGRVIVLISVPQARLAGGMATMTDLIRPLSNLLDRPVVDKTGITERLDVHPEFAADDILGLLTGPYGPAPSGATPSADPAGPSIFTALQEQLGLRLESAKGPVEVLVIDHVERPTEN